MSTHVHSRGTEPALIGRERERAELERMIGEARQGRSAVLVLRGEAGIGKTALLELTVEMASGFRVARALGVESEAELDFAALQQLLGPMSEYMDDLPPPQRDALGAAFGRVEGVPPERFLVGLATLSMLSSAAERAPLLCVVDDAQWLDRPSAQTLAFVARRLLAERVVLLFAARTRTEELEGLTELTVEGLDSEDSAALLSTALDSPADPGVRDRIIEQAAGNPLALIELPRGDTLEQFALVPGSSIARTPSSRIEQTFQRRIAQLPADTRQLLVVAAADELGDATKVWRAASLLGIGPAALTPAEAAQLLEMDLRVHFRHPLVRSAANRGASGSERRRANEALAQASDPELEPDRRAWHLAAAATGPDEDVAAELESAAGRVQRRGGLPVAARFLERAAELTPDPGRAAVRRLLAAGTSLIAGSHVRAAQLVEQSKPDLTDPAMLAQAMRIEGAVRFVEGRGGETPKLLFDAAISLEPIAPSVARETLMEAFEAAMWAGRLTSSTTILDVAEAGRAAPAPEPDRSIPSLLLTGYTERLTTGYAAAVEWWRRADTEHLTEAASHQWQGMLWNATGELFDFESHVRTSRQRVRLVREHGELANLPVALTGLAWTEVLSGRTDSADAALAEAGSIAAAIGTPEMPGADALMKLAVLCWRGADEARDLAAAVTRESFARGQGLASTLVQYMLVILELGHARYEDAAIAALNVYGEDPMYIGSIALADVVEATVRSGDLAAAAAALARLSERAPASGTPWALGLLARARALLAADEQADALYREAIEHFGGSSPATDRARAHLLYGEWLRRQRRRREARLQLRVACDMFDAMGTSAFAHRAEVELHATGERARTRVHDTRDLLTPQEQQIAELAGAGESNAAIAAQLFISPHTVAYHLRKVFSKLGINARVQLATIGRDPLDTTLDA